MAYDEFKHDSLILGDWKIYESNVSVIEMKNDFEVETFDGSFYGGVKGDYMIKSQSGKLIPISKEYFEELFVLKKDEVNE